ncbi:MAG TPA: hypothetical protein VFQ76_15860 [Longimicrobiaceae bacterium]|nr:hypothetical protein [Longimicrobiaceae bacterium]
MDRYEGRDTDRSADARQARPAESGYARRIDCCDSPRSRERSVGARGRGSPDAEPYSARSRRADLD